MIVTVIGAVLLFFVLVFSLLRFATGMAGALGWFLQNVIGIRSRAQQNLVTSAEDNSSTTSKPPPVKKKSAEPIFSTNLSEPIEDAIQETFTEDLKSKTSQPSTSKKKNKQLSKSNQNTAKEEGKPKPVETKRNEKSLKKKVSDKSKDATTAPNKDSKEPEVIVDHIGFSFFPVKEKGKGNKKKNINETKENKGTSSTTTELSLKKPKEDLSKPSIGTSSTTTELTLKKPKEDVSKPSIIDHYKKEKQLSEAVLSKNTANILEVQKSSILEQKIQVGDKHNTEVRESKKVCSSVSYANIVTNTFPEIKGNSGTNLQSEAVAQEVTESSLINADLKSTNQAEEKADTTHLSAVNKVEETENYLTETDQSKSGKTDTCSLTRDISNSEQSYFTEYENKLGTELDNSSKILEKSAQIIISGGLSKSESSSIEVIYEEQNTTDCQNGYFGNLAEYTELKESNENQTQFGIIEENLNKLVQETSELDLYTEKFGDSGSSLIHVIDSRTVAAEPEITKTEETRSDIYILSSDNTKIEPFSISGSDSFIESTKSLCTSEKRSSDTSTLDTFFVVEKESEQNGYIENELETAEDTSERTCQLVKDLIEKVVEEPLNEFKSEEESVDNQVEETDIKENNYISEVTNTAEIIEELQQLEKLESYTNQTQQVETKNTSEASNVKEFIEQEELVVDDTELLLKDQTQSQGVEVKENKYIPRDSDINEIREKSQLEANKSKSSDTESLFSHKKIEIITSVISNITDTVEDFLQLEKAEETENKLDFEENQKNLLNTQLTEVHTDLIELLDSKEEDLDRPKIPLEDSEYLEEQAATFIKKENSEETSEETEMAFSQIRVLTLNNQEHQECTLYRIEKNWAIQFRLGPSLFGRKVYLYCNYPVENKGTLAEFNRNQYQLLNWVLDEGCKNADDTAVYTTITAKLAGSFHYYFTFEKGENADRQGSGFFLVDPVLKYGDSEDLPLDCIQCQTVLAKSLGSFSTWEKKLQVAKESGYNMIHFTPIQALGISNSSYSLSEQLKFNPVFKKENGEMPKFEEIRTLIAKLRKEWKVTSICDIVLNHTANESEWIKVHPEVTYNCVNCPYMRPAYLLDAAFHQFSMDVKNELYEDKGIPAEVNTEDHLNAIRYHFRKSVLEVLKIEELFICDTSKLAADFFNLARATPPVTRSFKTEQEELRILQDKEYKRLASTVDMTLALKLYNVYRNDTFDEDSRLKRCMEEFKNKLDSLNNAIVEDVNDHLTAAIENVIAGIRYFRVQADGPRVQEITIKNPLVYRYFTDYGTPKNIKEHEEIMYSSNGRFLMAHNGWVMNSDPLKNFAAPDSNVYFRRELIAWGDSVKLRYGDGPKDCPFLWEHMKKYVEQTAEIFDGVRLDNCHSTPIPVAEYLLDCARRVRPDLYVVAELFTNSDMTDNIFVNRLGITSLIREAMSAWDSHEEGRLVYRYGGSPVGSFYQPRVRPLVPSVAHALFLDLTHDNPSPVEKRSVFDLLPSTALVNMACCASGSNRGYDELVPHHIHVVDESRQYTEWTEDENLAMGNLRYVTKKSGIILAKKAINDIHFTLGKEGYNQVYVDQMDPDVVAVTRHRPDTHESYILVAFTAFGHPNEDAAYHQRGLRSLRFEGVLDEIVLEATLSHVSTKTGGSKFVKWENFVKDSKWINGLSEYQVALKQHIQVNESDIFEKTDTGTPNVTQLNFKNFKPGSVVVIKASLPEAMKEAVKSVRSLINQFSLTKETELSSIIDKLTLADLNRVIYRCDQEERDEGFGFSTYDIPNFDSLVYAGLQGFISLLANIRPNNDLGHPMCANLRDGNWMIEYIWKRLKLDVGTKELGQWIEENTKFFNNIPRYLVPSYFDVVVTGIYVLLVEQCYKLMSNFVNHGSTFVRGLSLGSVQFGAYIKSADLPILSPNLAPPKPPTRKNDKGETIQTCVTLSAGLPHFSVGYMRNWGRDTFIALRGLFILTGRFEEARQHILGYAACLRHGLVPNLLDGGRNSRFNCRDALWWWLYCIKEYVEEAPNGTNILADKVSRIFPTDDSPPQPPGAVDQPLHVIIQEALKIHFQGLGFRERNAGRQIDEHMTDRGFNNQIGIHPETGFVFGGNVWNCGTWMDKMGSSDKAGNRGKPATPRDGSAVEIIGLSKAVVTWLWKLSQNKKYPYNGVERTHKNGSVSKWTFKEWSDKIQANFEKYFWVNTTPIPGEYRADLINKRGIYKDCFGATQDWSDFQLRCNFPIAMVVAPELFTPQQAWTALKQAEKYLLGPLGMKTLDPEDWAYRGDYDNSNDSHDASVANGFNYHQGPEWVWPVGFFLRAKLHFASLNGALPETVANTKVVLSKHFTELQTSVWRGLPELTNSDGSYCRDSSRTQAWSMSCILEVLRDLQKIESNQPVLIN